MNRRNFLQLSGSMSILALSPVRALLSSMGGAQQSAAVHIKDSFTPEQLDALQKIRYFEAQLQQQQGRFSWYLHNELRHYWGAFSEEKSLAHANAILEHSVMDTYIMNTLTDWHYAPEEQPCQPDLALESLQRRAKNYPELYYMGAACWLRAGEISNAIGETILARGYYKRVIDLNEKSKHQASQLWIYQRMAQVQLVAKL